MRRSARHLVIPTLFAALVPFLVPAAAGAVPAPPPDPGPAGLYLGVQPDIHPVVPPQDDPIVWGAAPPIDANYGGTLYAGTGAAVTDPRPALDEHGDEPLRMWMADPHDGRTGRPAIVWVHGGGFAKGVDSMYGLARSTAQNYASRGYVGFSVEYRIDSTVIGTSNNPSSLCQWVQDNENPTDAVWLARRGQCERNITAAQYDVEAAVRWIRAHADTYGIDPDRIAVGGFSAGAVTASNLAYQSDQVGDISYFPGDDRSVAGSKVQAAFGASGCTYSEDGGAPSTIDAGDAPIALIHSEYDQSVPYQCAMTTVQTARAKGLVAEMTSYCSAGGHANELYDEHRAATDQLWTNFLARELGLYSGLRPPTAAGFCTGPIGDTQLGHYVTRSYHDLLGRAPSSAELAAGVSEVSTSGRTAFEQGLVYSNEWTAHVVHDLYVTLLGREPDAGGLAYWVARVRAGMAVRDVAISLYGSAEYYAAHGGAPGPYVTALYDAILHRAPDADGLAYWTGQVATHGTAWVAAAFYQSLESRQDRVTGLYRELLLRSVDSGGRDYWAAQLLHEDDLALALELVTSDEYLHDA